MTTNIVQSISDEVLAEIESYASLYGHPQEAEACITFGDLRGLIARLKAAEVDAARYRFIRADISQGKKDLLIREKYWMDDEFKILVGAQADHALDAAMERAK